MTTHGKHYATQQLTDYALGLLADELRPHVAQHIAHCAACRARVQQEQALAQRVQRALAANAARGDAARLMRLMPAVPARAANVVRYRHAALQRGLAAAGLALFLLLGNLSAGRLGWHAAGRAYASPEPFVALATPAPATAPSTQTIQPALLATRTPQLDSLIAPVSTLPNAPDAVPAPGVPRR